MMKNSELIILGDSILISNGFIYVWSKKSNIGRTYWDYRKMSGKECTARVITVFDPSQDWLVYDYSVNYEECAAEIKTFRLKRISKEHPKQPLAQILCTKLVGVSVGVLSPLSEREHF